MRMNYLKSQMHKKWEDASSIFPKTATLGELSGLKEIYSHFPRNFSTITQQIDLLITFSFTTPPCDECRQQQSINTVHFLPTVF